MHFNLDFNQFLCSKTTNNSKCPNPTSVPTKADFQFAAKLWILVNN